MIKASLFLALILLRPDLSRAADSCAAHLTTVAVGTTFSPNQIEVTRRLLARILPRARECTLVRLDGLDAGLTAMETERSQVYGALDRIRDEDVVRHAPGSSPLGRVRRQIEALERDPLPFSVCLVREKSSSEILSVYLARTFSVGAIPKSGGPTFATEVFDSAHDVRDAQGFLLIKPGRFEAPATFPHLRESLLRAISTYEVTRGLHEWAMTQRQKLGARNPVGLLRYLDNQRGTLTVHAGLAQLLLFSQATSTVIQADPPRTAVHLESLRKLIAHYPEAQRFARKLDCDLSDPQLTDLLNWSHRTMRTVLGIAENEAR